MSQGKPAIHPVMYMPISEGGRDYLSAALRLKLRQQLADAMHKFDDAIVEEALEQVENACWRYQHRHLLHEEVPPEEQERGANPARSGTT